MNLRGGLRSFGVVRGSDRLQRVLPLLCALLTWHCQAPEPRDKPAAPPPLRGAPPLNQTVATTVDQSARFIYEGLQPLQRGVLPGVIAPQRAAVVRGRVLDAAGQPLAGVRVSVPQHEELGETTTQADGGFDLAVNGGAALRFAFHKAGYLPAQRQLQVPWQGYAHAPVVRLLGVDVRTTSVSLGGVRADAAPAPGAAAGAIGQRAAALQVDPNAPAGAFQVARGSRVQDSRGARQATVLFPPGTEAELLFPDEHTQAAPALHLSLTEFTVDPDGLAAMPADLPANSGYTYAVSLSAKEAEDAGASSVRFNQPVYFYLENFLGFTVGNPMPAGFFAPTQGQWVAEDSGRIVRVTALRGGVADLDCDGDGQAESDAALLAIGVTAAERQTLAGLYSAGQALWRVPLKHFTDYDLNLAVTGPADAPPPNPTPRSEQPICWPCLLRGSIIEAQNQIVGQAVPVTGTPFALHYQSDRVRGNLVNRRLRVSATGAQVHPQLQDAYVEISVGGQLVTQTFAPTANQELTFDWDGTDGYGRPVQSAPVRVLVAHRYPGTYNVTPRFGDAAGNAEATPGGANFRLLGEWQGGLGALDQRGRGLGGFSISPQHYYDPVARVLYYGDGRRRTSVEGSLRMQTVAGAGANAPTEGSLANDAWLGLVSSVAVQPDGSVLFTDSRDDGFFLRRVSPDGHLYTVAGGGTDAEEAVDGTPALGASLPTGIRGATVGPDGLIYFTTAYQVRRIKGDGTLETVAGSGAFGSTGDGGPALEATFKGLSGLTFAADGSLYIADRASHRVRRVTTDGLISAVAGNGLGGGGTRGENGPATAAQLRYPVAVAVASDGSLYIGQSGPLRRVGIDGIIRTVQGAGTAGLNEGAAARESSPVGVFGVAIAPDGSLYYSDGTHNSVRRVTPDGTVWTVAGNGEYGLQDENGAALRTRFRYPRGVALSPGGDLYICDENNYRLRKLQRQLPGVLTGDLRIPAEDGSELYLFDRQGRHLKTFDTLTGAAKFSFSYDSAGRLSSVVDLHGLSTTIERDNDGLPTAIVGPYGQRTSLTLNSDGYLSAISDPLGQAHSFEYQSGGLMTLHNEPGGEQHLYEYDAQGRLLRNTTPEGGWRTYLRGAEEPDGSTTIEVATAEGRVSQYNVRQLPGQPLRLTNHGPDGGASAWQRDPWSEDETRWSPDGTVTTQQKSDDPVYGSQARYISGTTTTTPGGISVSQSLNRAVTLADANNPLSVQQVVETLTRGGGSWTRSYSAATRTWTLTSPAGRTATVQVDEKGQILQTQEAGALPVVYTWDAQGRMTQVQQGTRTLTLAYNAAGHLASMTDPLGRVVSYSYDAVGQVTTQTFPDGRVVNFSYGADGRMTSLTPPGKPAHLMGYNAAQRQSSYTAPPVGQEPSATLTQSNLDDQVMSVQNPDGTSTQFTYDAGGRLSTVVGSAGTTALTYGSSGHVTQLTAPGGEVLRRGMDGGLLTLEEWAGTVSGNVGYGYDAHGRVAWQEVNGGNRVTYSYNADGLLSSVGDMTVQRDPQSGRVQGTVIGGVTDAYTYDAYGQVATYEAKFQGTMVYRYALTRDALGRITTKEEADAQESHSYDYAYDLAGRLVGVYRDGQPYSSYTYDANGNRLSHTKPDGTIETGTYDAQDRLIQYAGATYQYTARGTLQQKTDSSGTTSYDYDDQGNLRGVTLPDGKVISYVIDAQGRRVAKKVNGVLVKGWLYEGQLRIVAELDNVGARTSRFLYANAVNAPDLISKDEGGYRLLKDHLGSAHIVIDIISGRITERVIQDEFGQSLFDSTLRFQPFGFAGGLYDSQIDQVRFGARDYDVTPGRWLAKDPISFMGKDLDLYAYANNDPINIIDIDGKFWIVAGVVVIAGVSVLIFNWLDPVLDDASRLSLESNPKFYGTPQGRLDAYRHCLGGCFLAEKVGPWASFQLGLLMEDYSSIHKGQDAFDYYMDVHNNRCGANLSGAGHEQCQLRCTAAVLDNTLVFDSTIGNHK